MKTDQFHRRGFKEVRENVENLMGQQFKSPLVDELKSNNFVIEKDGVTVHLAKDFGFCWGVERSIALAYEAVEHFPGKTVHITNELIHNPEVNDKLHEMNVQFIEKLGEGKDPWGGYRAGFAGTTTLTLKDFNIKMDLGPASSNVQLDLTVEGIRK